MGKVIWKPGTFEYPIPVVMVTSGDFENCLDWCNKHRSGNGICFN